MAVANSNWPSPWPKRTRTRGGSPRRGCRRRHESTDRDRLLHFAPLQGETAARLGVDWDDDGPASADTFVFVDNTGAEPVLHERMAGVAAELRAIGRMRPLAAILEWTPDVVADGIYKLIAASRYRLFGRFDQCELPTRSQRERFLP